MHITEMSIGFYFYRNSNDNKRSLYVSAFKMTGICDKKVTTIFNIKGGIYVKKGWKLLSMLTVMMLVVGMLAACSSGSKGEVSIGIVLPTKDEPRWVQDETRFKDALADSKYTTEILLVRVLLQRKRKTLKLY